jgi:hypothetical protein
MVIRHHHELLLAYLLQKVHTNLFEWYLRKHVFPDLALRIVLYYAGLPDEVYKLVSLS